MTHSRTNDLAFAAKRLSENEDFVTLMSEIEAQIFAGFQQVSLGDVDNLTNIHALSHGFRLIQKRLNNFIDASKIEIQNIESY